MPIQYQFSGQAIGGYGQKENFGGTFNTRAEAEQYRGSVERTYSGWQITSDIKQIGEGIAEAEPPSQFERQQEQHFQALQNQQQVQTSSISPIQSVVDVATGKNVPYGESSQYQFEQNLALARQQNQISSSSAEELRQNYYNLGPEAQQQQQGQVVSFVSPIAHQLQADVQTSLFAKQQSLPTTEKRYSGTPIVVDISSLQGQNLDRNAYTGYELGPSARNDVNIFRQDIAGLRQREGLSYARQENIRSSLADFGIRGTPAELIIASSPQVIGESLANMAEREKLILQSARLPELYDIRQKEKLDILTIENLKSMFNYKTPLGRANIILASATAGLGAIELYKGYTVPSATFETPKVAITEIPIDLKLSEGQDFMVGIVKQDAKLRGKPISGSFIQSTDRGIGKGIFQYGGGEIIQEYTPEGTTITNTYKNIPYSKTFIPIEESPPIPVKIKSQTSATQILQKIQPQVTKGAFVESRGEPIKPLGEITNPNIALSRQIVKTEFIGERMNIERGLKRHITTEETLDFTRRDEFGIRTEASDKFVKVMQQQDVYDFSKSSYEQQLKSYGIRNIQPEFTLHDEGIPPDVVLSGRKGGIETYGVIKESRVESRIKQLPSPNVEEGFGTYTYKVTEEYKPLQQQKLALQQMFKSKTAEVDFPFQEYKEQATTPSKVSVPKTKFKSELSMRGVGEIEFDSFSRVKPRVIPTRALGKREKQEKIIIQQQQESQFKTQYRDGILQYPTQVPISRQYQPSDINIRQQQIPIIRQTPVTIPQQQQKVGIIPKITTENAFVYPPPDVPKIKIPKVPPPEIPFIRVPPPPPFIIPRFKMGQQKYEFGFIGGSKRKSGYTSSLIAEEFGIKAKLPLNKLSKQTFTGLEIRGLSKEVFTNGYGIRGRRQTKNKRK